VASVSLPGPADALGAEPGGGASTGRGGWWFPPTALGRVAALRLLAYAFVPVDVLLTTAWVGQHGDVPGVLYRPVMVARLLHLPTPTRTGVDLLKVALLVAAAAATVALLTRTTALVRAAGTAVFALYGWWMLVAMSYGKVDHDRFAFLVLLAVLPTVGAAALGERRRSLQAGWAVRMTQVAVVATYFFAAWSKLRFGGWNWATGATLTRAVLRRGTDVAQWTLDHPGVMRGFQWGLLLLELAAPLLLFVRRDRTRYAIVGGLVAFHGITYLAISIIFLPHVVALMAFLPLERLGRRGAPSTPASTAPRAAPASGLGRA
jgi:hypothetical protein